MGIFQKWQLPQCAIFQVCPSRSLWPLAHPIRSARAPHCSLQRHRGPNLTFGKLRLVKLHIWEVATWKIVTWEVALGKITLLSPS